MSIVKTLLAGLLLILVSCKEGKNKTVVRTNKTTETIAEKKEKQKLKFAVLPLGNIGAEHVKQLSEEIRNFYEAEVTILPREDMPSMAWYAPRQRYRADSLLLWIKLKRQDQYRSIIAITDKDISVTSGDVADWGIFGLGDLPGNAAVMSVFRLKKRKTDLSDQIAKVGLHELGHNLGLRHCSQDTLCMMNDAQGKGATLDREKKWFCPACRKKLG